MYDYSSGGLLSYDSGASVYVDGKSPVYIARSRDISSYTTSKIVALEIWICPQQSNGVVDGYLNFRVKASDYYADYVRFPIQRGANVVFKNDITGSTSVMANTTHIIFPQVDVPPGHWVGTGSLTADLTIQLCTPSQSTLPPSYFSTSIYYGPYRIGATSLAAQSCGTTTIGLATVYCCTYRNYGSWSWINSPDSIGSTYAPRMPMGQPFIVGPIPLSQVVYAVGQFDIAYRGQRRPDIAPPDSWVYRKRYHNFGEVVQEFMWVAVNIASRIDVKIQLSGGTLYATYVPVVISPRVLISNGQTKVFQVPKSVEVLLSTDGRLGPLALVAESGGKTIVSSRTIRDVIKSISPVLDVLAAGTYVPRTTAFVTRDPRAADAAPFLLFIGTTGKYIVSSAESSVITVQYSSNVGGLHIDIGWAERSLQHSAALQPLVGGTRVSISAIIIHTEQVTFTYYPGAVTPLSDRLTLSNSSGYTFRTSTADLTKKSDMTIHTSCDATIIILGDVVCKSSLCLYDFSVCPAFTFPFCGFSGVLPPLSPGFFRGILHGS